MLRSISPGRAPLAEYDSGVLWAALLLLTFGMVMVYSSSIAMAEASRFTGGKSAYFLERHALFLAASLFAGMVAFRARRRAARPAARSRTGPGSQRSASLALARACNAAALRVHEAVRRSLRGRLHRAQARPDAQLQAGPSPDVCGDAGGRLALAARARLRRFRRDHGDHHGDPVPGRHERQVVRGFARDDGGGLRRTGPVFPVPHAADLRLHGSLVGSVRPRLPAFARADRIRPRRVVRRRIGGEHREAPLSPRSAYRLPARRDRRRAGIR